MNSLRKILPFLMLAGVSAFAQDMPVKNEAELLGSVAHEVDRPKGLVFTDPTTLEKRLISFEDTQKPEVLVTILPRIEGVESLYRTYVAKGYHPFHALILTNADISDALRQIDPNIPENKEFNKRIESIRQIYQPKQEKTNAYQ